MILPVLFYAFVVFAGIQITYYLFFTSFLFKSKKTPKSNIETPVSVIICAKNEAENLEQFLPCILTQTYTKFQVVLINDASSDHTLEVMESFRKKHNNIKIIDVENVEAFWGNKKYALTLGIKAAKYEQLLFTDADCKPVSKHWISEMSKNFSEEKSIILGYGKYKKKKTLVNLFVRFETLLTAIQYFSYTKLGAPYMAVGRNLAYKKSEFFKVNGFINHIQIKSGDDDLFIQDASDKENTAICLESNSFTISNPPKTFKEWFRQKRRHISTANYYKLKHQLLLGLFYLSKVLFFSLGILCFFLYSVEIIGAIFLLYYIIEFLVVGLAAKKLKESKVVYFLPILEIGLLFFHFSIFIRNFISKPNHWK